MVVVYNMSLDEETSETMRENMSIALDSVV